MKKALLLLSLFLIYAANTFAQLSIALAPPALAAPWTYNGSVSTTVGGAIRLTPATNNQLGRVVYNPTATTNITACGQFTVDFDFAVTGGTNPVADGMTFFFVNPLTGFVAGMGLGLPNPTDGFILALDTWDNGSGLTPLAAAYGFPSTYTGTYVEGSPTDLIGNIDNNQNWIVDGTYHHVHITYAGGLISVWLNTAVYTGTPNITGNFPITQPGVFGFTASTGGSNSNQWVKNVVINSNTISPITGTTALCLGATTTLTDPSVGTWSSSNTSVATINSTTGLLGTVGTGTTTITYSYSGTCLTTSVVTVGAPPTAIAGNTTVCIGQVSNLSDGVTGGTWTSSNTTIATIVPSTGVVTGVALGTATITYSTAGTGCYATANITVGSSPGTITGINTVCAGSTTTLSDATAGGSWSSTVSSVATVISGSGFVSGTTIGTTVISYTIGAGCASTTSVIVTSTPSTISGNTTICPTATTILSDAAAGGTWTSSVSSVATVGSSSGIVTGVATAGGTTVITYTNACSSVTTSVVVTPLPTAISGITTVCTGLTTTLSDPILGGVWSTGNSTLATVVGGVVTGGATGGTATINYSNGCGAGINAVVTVIAQPGTITGNKSVCAGLTSTLSDIASGTWTSSSTTIATVGSLTGIVTGVAPGGIVNITYSNGCGTAAVTSFTVNTAPTAITGITAVCSGLTTILSDAIPNGTWTSSVSTVATVTPGPGATGGVVTGGAVAGTSVIRYSNSCGTTVTTTVTVNVQPGNITGSTGPICSGLTTILSDAANGTWSTSNSSIAIVGSSTGLVTAGTTGGNVTITYSNGCGTNAVTTVTVTAAPAAITGPTGVCAGANITLSDAVTGGTWTSANTHIVTVTQGPTGGGVVTGVSTTGGSTTVTYANGCGTPQIITIAASTAPTTISGPALMCLGITNTLSNDGSPTGTWTSSVTTVATIDVNTGVIGSVGAGVTIVTAQNQCGSTTYFVTVSVPSTISGVTSFCQNGSTTLSNAVSGGTWSSGNVLIAYATGIVNDNTIYGGGLGVPTGCTQITYTLPGGCIATTTVCTTPTPTSITGLFSMCVGSTIYLTDATVGGIWTSTAPAGITSTGMVTSGSAGSSVISYAIGVCAATATMTINPLPGPIGGPPSLCVGNCGTFIDGVLVGAWSSSNSIIATIDPSGNSCGVIAGTSTITFTLNTGCSAVTTLTVNPLPGPITGNTTLCLGQTSQLSNVLSPGTWGSSAPGIAAISSSGFVTTGPSTGTATITYTLPSGCYTTTVVTVNPLPSTIIGATTVCTGATMSLTDAPAGGTWSSSSNLVATVGSLTGVVTGGGVPGTVLITYSIGTGCSATTTVVVHQTPGAITGNTSICAGSQSTLSDSPAGGVWSSSNISVATIGSLSGVVSAIAGVATQSTFTCTFVVAGCSALTTVTVNPLPGNIIGPSSVCVGLSIALTDNTGGGTWSSSAPGIAPIGVTSGVITGIAPGGTATITDMLTTGCSRNFLVTVNPLPAPITGITTVCAGLTTNLSDATTGGTWSSTSVLVASVNSTNGLVTAGNPTVTTTDIITYTLVTGCTTTILVTVNPLPLAISGINAICVGSSTTLSDPTPNGTWSSSATLVATVTPGPPGGTVYGVSGGTSRITYTLIATGCTNTTTMTVNPLPTTISGLTTICAGQTTPLSDGSTGGVWSSNSAAVSVTPGPVGGGIITGATGIATQSTATVTYTAGFGCAISTVVTVNPVPLAIAGNTVICAGLTTTLSDPTPAGTWSSATPLVAAIDVNSGFVTGGSVTAQSTSRITYTLIATGCTATTNVTVNPLPLAITGPSAVCEGGTINLSEAITGGAWSATNGSASVTSAGVSVVVTGVTTGGALSVQDTIINTLGTGCVTTKTVTVNIQPTAIINGPLSLCDHSCANLSDAVATGVWTSGNASIATVDPATALVCGSMPGAGVGGGTTNITYTIGSCRTVTSVLINAQPVAITGNTNVCAGSTTTLSDATPGGVWSSSNNTLAPVVPSAGGGQVTGGSPAPGVALITYSITNPTGSCQTSTSVTVNVQPDAIAGISAFCNLSSTTLSDDVSGGVWSSSNTYAIVGSLSGIVTGAAPLSPAVTGSSVITYTESVGGCFATRVVTINIQPVAITGITQICNGSSTQLSDGTASGTWSIEPATASIAVVNSTGLVTGNSAGLSGTDGMAYVDYTIGSCVTTTTVIIHPLPSVMTGAFYICKNSVTTLADLSPSGTWTSNNPSIASVVVNSGIVTGVNIGGTTLTYTLPTGCLTTHSVQVIAVPSAISPASPTVCTGLTTQLSDLTNGGTWSLSNTNIATIDQSGLVSGITGGTVVISYTLGTGCSVVGPFIVNPLSQITGITTVCIGQTTNLSDSTYGGTWTSSNLAVATVNSVTGVVYGNTAGTTVIVYNLPTGCSASKTVTVLPLPLPITGITTICDGGTTTLSDASPGGVRKPWEAA